MSAVGKKDDEKSYPFGNNTVTHNVLVLFVAFNIIAVSVMFLAYIEIPFIQGEDVFEGLSFEQFAYAQIIENPELPDIGKPDVPKVPGAVDFYIDCFIIIVSNIILTLILIRVGHWIKTTIYVQTKGGLWYIRSIYLWTTYTISIISATITFYLIWICITTPRIG